MRPCTAYAFLAASILLAVACSFFDPRTPDAPDPGDITWQQPTSPSLVVQNLVNSMEGRSASFCMNCCDSSYMFIADPSDSVEFILWGWVFADWNYDVEYNTLQNIFAAVVGSGYPEDSLVSVTMTPVSGYPDPAAPSDSADVWRDYSIVCAGSEYGGWDRPALGRVRFSMVEDDFGLWWISTWEDIRPEDYSGENWTWGVIKAGYR
jgi:hypothetical protein